MNTIDKIRVRVNNAVAEGVEVLVDGHRVRAARTREGELEVDWWRDEPEPLWTTIQPNFMGDDDGKLIIKTD